MSRPSGRSGSYTGLIGFNPRRLQVPKRGMSSHSTDLSVYAKSSLLLLLSEQGLMSPLVTLKKSFSITCTSTDNLTGTTKRQNTHKHKIMQCSQSGHHKWHKKANENYDKIQNRHCLVQSPFVTSGQETEWVCSLNPRARAS